MTEQPSYEQLKRLEPGVLTEEISRLQNTIAHLERSNAELAEAHSEDPDVLYLSTIEENKEVIVGQRARIEMIKEAFEDTLGIDAQSTHYNAPVTTIPQQAATSTLDNSSTSSEPRPMANGLVTTVTEDNEDQGMHL